MAHGTNTIYISILSFQLRTAGIAIDIKILTNSNRTSTVTIIISRSEVVCMRPDSIGIATIGCAFTCINDIDLIYIAIAIPVVLFPVRYLLFSKIHCFANHLASIHIIALTVIFTIIANIFANTDRTNNIEVKLKLSTTLSLEIVCHGALEVSLRESFLIGYTIEERIVMTSLKRLILEVHQNHNSLLMA